LQNGADVDVKNNFNESPLHCSLACICRTSKIVKLIIEKNTDISTVSKDGLTPLATLLSFDSFSTILLQKVLKVIFVGFEIIDTITHAFVTSCESTHKSTKFAIKTENLETMYARIENHHTCSLCGRFSFSGK
jgi:hypothetical protein